MRISMAFLAAWCAVTTMAFAATPASVPTRSLVKFQVNTTQKLFLPGEAMPLELTLQNNTGSALTFLPEDAWLDFTVWNQLKSTGEGYPVQRVRPVRIAEPLKLEHTATGKARVDLAPCFDLTRPGRYQITAAMVYPGAERPVAAEAFTVEVTPGYKLREREFGLPAKEEGAAPETRKYSLVRLSLPAPGEMRWYVSVTDSREDTIFRQTRIGRAAGGDQPQVELDRLNNWHVLHQTEPRLFAHTIISPRGDILTRESYTPTGPRPGLRLDDSGLVSVSGGAREARADDILPLPLPPLPGNKVALP